MSQRYIGLMSGTSMDGIDAVLADIDGTRWQAARAHFFVPYPDPLRQQLLALQDSGSDELHRAALLAQTVARLYAQAVNGLLAQEGLAAADIAALGAHGQTVRHAPEHGYTVQLIDLPLLAELTGIDCIGDFRSRDLAGGGQGAPLVPAFHQAVFGHPQHERVLLNIGGIANISILPPDGRPAGGFDTGPGNMLADAYMQHYRQQPYDRDGALAAGGRIIEPLLAAWLAHPYFQRPAPKSTGRELFSFSWLQGYLKAEYRPADIMRTLNAFTARSIAEAVRRHAPAAREMFVCGGGTCNPVVMAELRQQLAGVQVATTDDLHLAPQWVEAAAFAWLAACRIHRRAAGPHRATGAARPYVLGAWHCA